MSKLLSMPVVMSEFDWDRYLIEVIQSLCNTHGMFSDIPGGNFLSDTPKPSLGRSLQNLSPSIPSLS
jgi:hypothetical protein